MAIKQEYIADFEEEKFYHIFSRSNNREPLFQDVQSRTYFITRFNEHIAPFVKILAWNLQISHFHFVVQVKSRNSIVKYLERLSGKRSKRVYRKYLKGQESAARLLSYQWRRLLISYAMYFNKKYERHGNLFHRVFKRVCLKTDPEIRNALLYVKGNSCKHHMSRSWRNHKWTSYFLPKCIGLSISLVRNYLGKLSNLKSELDLFWRNYFEYYSNSISSFKLVPD